MAPRVLVVEDDDWSLQLVVYLLKAANYDVVSARGAEGLEVARQERSDLILMDLQMPRMDGYEAARLLNEDRDLRAIPLVAVTALAMVGDRDRVLQAALTATSPSPSTPKASGPRSGVSSSPIGSRGGLPHQPRPLPHAG